ncbi:MAG: hypothetical protein GX951_00230 [Mollicutes bacterium]|nr:hypothetical protein [Mollicutes bacterium]
MKKFIISILLLLSFFIVNVKAEKLPEVTDHEKVTIYIFRGDGCGYCGNAIEWFYNLGDKYDDYFQVITYEVWNNDSNAILLEEVAAELDVDISGVPFIVLGDKFYVTGFSPEDGEELVDVALEEYQNKKYKDIVAKISKEISDDLTKNKNKDNEEIELPQSTSLYAAAKDEGFVVDNSSDTAAILGISAVVAIVILGFIVITRKQN